jgi:hypothetical protein
MSLPAGLPYGTYQLIVSANGIQSAPDTFVYSPTQTKPPAISFSSNVIRFGTQKLGTATAWQQQTVKNIGGSTLTFSSITLTGDSVGSYKFTTTCGSSLAPGAHCLVSEYFKPLHTGARTAAVTFADNTSHTPQKIYLTGTGKK